MKYSNAQKVLPDEIIKLIQEYVSGEYLYIPRKAGKEKAWGENSGSRKSLDKRNEEIYDKYCEGISVLELMKEYYLSDKSIRRIIGERKKICSKSIQKQKWDWLSFKASL